MSDRARQCLNKSIRKYLEGMYYLCANGEISSQISNQYDAAGGKSFLVKWEGYKQKSWEPESSLLNTISVKSLKGILSKTAGVL